MTLITRACLVASVVLCFAIEPASAQYNVFTSSRSGLVLTDVIVNGVPATIGEVKGFEQRCNVEIAAGRWWRDNNGNLGLEGGPAQFNEISCQFLGQNAETLTPTTDKPKAKCTFFSGGSTCSGL
jgi:hypothetical protein